MNKSTAIAIVAVCAGISLAALWSIKRERDNWTTTTGGAPQAPPPVPSSVDKPASSQTAISSTGPGMNTPASPAEKEAADRENVRALLRAGPEALTDDGVALVQRVVHQKGSGPDDGASEMRMALAIAGDKKFLAVATAQQAATMKDLVIEALKHPVWRMRRVAIGNCAETGWLAEPPIRAAVEKMEKSDSSMEVRLSAKRALEQADKAAARKATGGP